MGPGQWSTGKATQEINACAKSASLNITFVKPVKDRLRERGLIMGDALYVLRRGFVLEDPGTTTRPGFFKYLIEATTPNSEGRTVGILVIPDGCCMLKLTDVKWRDEL
ncbi:hypothetical protein [Phenylobacterium sp. NIBR 498073]|uniref:hypothetical protein n=1 Tax=Phenylobacterium sp. NIBR 498073 TaxID=3015177 RepID=UPI0022B4C229|nr:hypothetical protein [Phenylobacterium sp. NIBR 498073]WGU40347.1 hypothetical protein O4N75_01130 [Phenylobacterium sp. NIBR 498073]